MIAGRCLCRTFGFSGGSRNLMTSLLTLSPNVHCDVRVQPRVNLSEPKLRQWLSRVCEWFRRVPSSSVAFNTERATNIRSFFLKVLLSSSLSFSSSLLFYLRLLRRVLHESSICTVCQRFPSNPLDSLSSWLRDAL